MKKELKKLGRLFGQDVYIDMTDCDPRTFKHAEDFFNRTLKDAEAIRKIKEILSNEL